MGTFQAKEGLFEFSVKRLGAEEREEAVRRIEKNVPSIDPSLKAFLNIGNPIGDDSHLALPFTQLDI
jgi:hypothetical protein